MTLSYWCHLCSVAWSCPTLCNPINYSLLGSSVHGILQARTLEWVSHSLFQGISLIQGSNPGLLHCRQILYPLSHQGIPSPLWAPVYLSVEWLTKLDTLFQWNNPVGGEEGHQGPKWMRYPTPPRQGTDWTGSHDSLWGDISAARIRKRLGKVGGLRKPTASSLREGENPSRTCSWSWVSVQRGFEFRHLFIVFTVKPSNFQGCKKRHGLEACLPAQAWGKPGLVEGQVRQSWEAGPHRCPRLKRPWSQVVSTPLLCSLGLHTVCFHTRRDFSCLDLNLVCSFLRLAPGRTPPRAVRRNFISRCNASPVEIGWAGFLCEREEGKSWVSPPQFAESAGNFWPEGSTCGLFGWRPPPIRDKKPETGNQSTSACSTSTREWERW